MEVDSDHEAGASGGAGTSGAVSKDRKRFEVRTINPRNSVLEIPFSGLDPNTHFLFAHKARKS